MLETYRTEIESALRDRDKAHKELHELKETVKEMMKDRPLSSRVETNLNDMLINAPRPDWCVVVLSLGLVTNPLLAALLW